VFELYSRFAPIAHTPREGWCWPLRGGPDGEGRGRLVHGRGRVPDGDAGAGAVRRPAGQQALDALEDAVHAIDPRSAARGGSDFTPRADRDLAAVPRLYLVACALASGLTAGEPSTLDYARAFAPTLIPIAVGYHFAHSFTYLLVQGQSIVFLVSDPFGLGWNLFGTRDAVIDIAIIGTRTAWYLALGAIVAGHAISVFLAHARAERPARLARLTLRALLPLTVLMVLYTIISLQILAEPLVRYSGPQETII